MKKMASTEAGGCRMDGGQDAKKEILGRLFPGRDRCDARDVVERDRL
jgi:hypothetical protein